MTAVNSIVVIGEDTRIQGYALAGAVLRPAPDAAAVRAAWRALPPDVGLVVLTAAAAEALDGGDRERTWPLVAVMG